MNSAHPILTLIWAAWGLSNKIFLINVFVKNVSGVYFVRYFKVKNRVLGDFKSISEGNRPFSALFLYILEGLEGLFDFFDSLHYRPLARNSPRQ